jgi:pimeloyl-ACP methyl ester carboxylesterase
LSGTAQAQPFQVINEALVLQDSYYTQRPVKVRLFQPSVDGQALAPSGSFPILVFGHGFVMDHLDYTNVFNDLAAEGYFVATLDEGYGFGVNHQVYAGQMAGAARAFLALNSTAGSPFQGRVLQKAGTMGHSMGGGASMFSTYLYPELSAAVGLAPAQSRTTPDAIASLLTNTVPVLIISGNKDGVTPNEQHATQMYANTKGDKFWVDINRGGHCGFADRQTVCDVGANASNDRGTLTYAEQQGYVKKYALPFLNFYLKGQPAQLSELCVAATADTSIVFVSNKCGNVSRSPDATVLKNDFARRFSLRNTGLTIEPPASGQPESLRLVSATGQSLANWTLSGSQTLNIALDHLPTGLYQVSNGVQAWKFVWNP